MFPHHDWHGFCLHRPLIDTVANYYSDFKHPHGYMIFLTPKNGFRSSAPGAFAVLNCWRHGAGRAHVANFTWVRPLGTRKRSLIFEGISLIPDADLHR